MGWTDIAIAIIYAAVICWAYKRGYTAGRVLEAAIHAQKQLRTKPCTDIPADPGEEVFPPQLGGDDVEGFDE